MSWTGLGAGEQRSGGGAVIESLRSYYAFVRTVAKDERSKNESNWEKCTCDYYKTGAYFLLEEVFSFHKFRFLPLFLKFC